MLIQFKCYKCDKITEYVKEDYESPDKVLVVADRIYLHYVECKHCGSLNRVEFQLRKQSNGTTKQTNDLGRSPTTKEKFYHSLAGEIIKNNSNFANSVLQQIITLATALLAGTVVIINKDFIKSELIIFIYIFFLTGLVIAFKGIFPYSREISFINPQSVEHFSNSALKSKLRCIFWSGLAIGIGLLLIVIGGISKALGW